MTGRERRHSSLVDALVHGVHVNSGSDERALDRERPRELPLGPHDLATVALQLEEVPRLAQALPLEKKPSEEIPEGFDGER
jgi:hypothetical protein